jgi:hypothetical protein
MAVSSLVSTPFRYSTTFGSRSICIVSRLTPADPARLARFRRGSSESIGSVKLAFHLRSLVPQQLQHRADTLAALGTAAAGRVHFVRALAAHRGGRLSQFSIGQRIAQADIHDLASIRLLEKFLPGLRTPRNSKLAGNVDPATIPNAHSFAR